MSIALMTLAWKTSLPAGQKMVLLALCDNANDQGECYPSITMLAEKCSLSQRSVQQHINDMEAVGILSREMRHGRSTLYCVHSGRFNTPATAAPRKSRTPQDLHPTPADSAPPPPQRLHPTPATAAPITIKEPSVEPSRNHQKGAKPAAPALPDWMPPDAWQSWVEYRKSIKAPLSQKAANLCLTKLEKLRAEGQDPVAVIDQSIMSGKWTGLFPIRDESQPRSGSQGSVASDKFRVANLDHSSSRAAMEASIKRHGITVPDGDIEF